MIATDLRVPSQATLAVGNRPAGSSRKLRAVCLLRMEEEFLHVYYEGIARLGTGRATMSGRRKPRKTLPRVVSAHLNVHVLDCNMPALLQVVEEQSKKVPSLISTKAGGLVRVSSSHPTATLSRTIDKNVHQCADKKRRIPTPTSALSRLSPCPSDLWAPACSACLLYTSPSPRD